ncbi:MAG: serine hydrolase, partial [Woeseiaceae bacterium]|nr:serine hydrolase [Woeseiaceae bacterium]
GLNEKIAQYFPNHSSQFIDPLKSIITIEDLLTMTAGIKWDESSHAYTNPMNNAASMENSNNWIDYILSLPMEYKPGEKFVYNSGITVLLSHILHEASGMHADEYAEKYLFNKLGIQDYFWKKTPNNLTDAEGGLYLSTRDFAKIGMLYLNDGRWNGSQIITNEWVELTMSPDTDIEESSRKYGFQWWLVPYENNQEKWMYSGSGYGGQYLLIVPEYQLVMVFNGWNIFDIPRPSIEYLSQRVLEAIQ